jgi:hypothetical protein
MEGDPMRVGLVLCVGLVLVAASAAQQADAPKRYNIARNLDSYPQATPKEALASVLTAIENKRVDYLLAHLADPDFVDKRVREVYGGDFDELVKESTTKLHDSPAAVKELQRFLKEGEWESGEGTATAKLKDVADRQVTMKKIGDRWFLENQQKPDPSK